MTVSSKRFTSHPPKITFEQALDARFVLGECMYAVRSCPASVLKQLVESRIEGTKRGELLELPALLDADGEDITRWYVLETMLRNKVKIPFVA